MCRTLFVEEDVCRFFSFLLQHMGRDVFEGLFVECYEYSKRDLMILRSSQKGG